MKKIILKITLPFLLLYSGCTDNSLYSTASAPTQNLSSSAGMIQYLQDIPAVKNSYPWSNPYGQGITIETAHYHIHTTLMQPLVLRQLPGFIESAYAAYQKQLPHPIETKTSFTIYLFASRSQWESFTRSFTGPHAPLYLKIQKGAYYLNDAVVAYHIGTSRTFAVLGHEGWHHFNSKHSAFRLPSWLDEGIATTFETTRTQNGTFDFDPSTNGGRLASLKKTLAEGNMIPLRQLITLNPGYIIDDTSSILAFYAQSYALVRFLREDRYGFRLRNYQNMLLGAFEGNWPISPDMQAIAADRNKPLTIGFNAAISPMLFETYIGSELDMIEAQYIQFCKKIVYNLRFK